MSNQNNQTISRDSLSELDKIFIPEDLDGNVSREDLTSYRQGFKFWRTVPKNYSIVRKNIFTQEVTNVEGHGIKFLVPGITKTILVPRHDATKKYENIQAFSSDGVALKVNFNIVMQISNPAKYITEGKHQSRQLDSLIKRLLLDYASRFGFEHSITGNCNIADFDPRNELESFNNQYGINVKKVLVERVELPENIRKQHNDLVEARQRRAVQNIDLAAAREKANSDAEIMKIKADAEAETLATRIASIARTLKAEGYTEAAVKEAINTYLVSITGNVIIAGNNQHAMDIAAGITGGGRTRGRTPNDTNPTR